MGAANLANVLRRLDSVTVVHQPHWLTGRADLWLIVGSRRLLVGRRVSARALRQLDQLQRKQPVAFRPVAPGDARAFWRYEDRWYVDRDALSADQVHALLVTRERRRSAQLSRARAQVVAPDSYGVRTRGYVADEVKHFVWERDQGRCVSCGSTIELQYDHVIPVALGGGSAAENLQIMCGPCNRRKGVDLVVG